MSRDLSPFVEDNAVWKQERKRIPWDQRVEMIDKAFPSARNADWNVILRDNDILARLLKDILKVDQIEPGRAGPRPNLDYERGMQSWREITGQDFCELPFAKAFQALTKQQSFATIARKINVSKTRTFRLWHGTESPTVDDMRMIAKAYGKKPAYFAEYRAEYILALMATRLMDEPELTVAVYMKLVRA